MSIVLYRKYRPQEFSEVIGQKHVVKTLLNALKMDKVAHAYLFCGPRGTGKTTVARLLAKAVNCTKKDRSVEPCNKCESCENIINSKALDLIEIDAASNRGIDEIRELKEKVRVTPTRSKFKVFIIDEVHMLTEPAFNALLKTLEEPPQHAMFILCTTEVHKIPVTILSRCQRFDFKKLSLEEIKGRIKIVSKKEKVKIEDKAAELIAKNSDGAVRDAESLLAQIISLEDKNITLKEVKNLIGISDDKSVSQLINLLADKNDAKAIELVNKIFNEGHDLQQFTKALIEYLRKLLIINTDKNLAKYIISEETEENIERLYEQTKKFNSDEIIFLLKLFIDAERDIKFAAYPQLPLELVIVEFCKKQNGGDEKKNIEDANSYPPKENLAKKNLFNKKSLQSENIKHFSIRKIPDKNTSFATQTVSIAEVRNNWNNVIDSVREHNHSISAFLKVSEPICVNGNCLTLGFRYKFHKERIWDYKNKEIVEKVLEQVFANKIFIKCVIQKSGSEGQNAGNKIAGIKNKESENKNNLVGEAMRVFGGKIVT